MNKIFKVIFNKSMRQWVVVSELGKSKQRDKSWGNLSLLSLKNGLTVAIFGVSTLALSIQSALAQENTKIPAVGANQIDPHLIAGDDPTSSTDSQLSGYSITNVLANEVGEDPFIKEPLLNTDIDKYILISPTGQITVGKMRKGENSFLRHLSQHHDGQQDTDSIDLEALKNFLVLGYVKGNKNAAGTSDNEQLWRSTIQIMGSDAQSGSTYSSDNITTVYSKDGKDGTITIKMKEDPAFKKVTLTDATNSAVKTLIDGRGVIIHTANGGKVSLTEHGLDNGGNPIRQVGDGEQDTDAVNLRQLKDATSGLSKEGLKFGANSGTTVTNKLGSEISIQGAGIQADTAYSAENIKTKVNQDGTGKTSIDIMLAKDLVNLEGVHLQDGPSLTHDGIDAAHKSITNVKSGKIHATSEDAINGSQFNALGNILGLTPNPDLIGFHIPTFQPLVKTNGDIGVAATDYHTAINDVITKLNQGFIVNGNAFATNTLNGQQYLGSTISIVGSSPSVGTTYSDKNITTVYQKDEQGNGSITIKMSETPAFEQVTLGKNDANSAYTIIDGNGLIIHSPNGGKVTVTEHGLDNGGNVISNVAKGEAATDAVNKSQLDEAIKDSIIDLTDKGLLFNANSGHTVTNKLGSEVTIRGDGNLTDDQYSGENIKTRVSQDTSGKTIIDIMLAKNLAVDSIRANNQIIVGNAYQNVSIKDDGIHIQNGPNLTVGGLDNGGKVISHVADGVHAQDAVTISQLEKVYTTLKDQLDKGLDFSGNTGGYINSQLGSKVEIFGDGKNIQTHIEKVSNDTSRVNIQLNDNLHVKDITLQDDPNRGTTKITQDGLSIKSANGDKNVSLTDQGLDNGGNVISNVADGKAQTDAVNVKQLGALANEVDELKKNIGGNVGKALADIRHQIKENRKESHAGSAAAIAAANLPQPFSAGRSMVSAAIGSYHSQQAVSIGVSRISENGKWIVKSSITQDTQSNFGAGMGLGYQW